MATATSDFEPGKPELGLRQANRFNLFRNQFKKSTKPTSTPGGRLKIFRLTITQVLPEPTEKYVADIESNLALT